MGSPGFFLICVLHSLIALTCGVLMMFYSNEVSVFGHGPETARQGVPEFLCQGMCACSHSMAVWRVLLERNFEDLARDLPRQVVGDIALALSWMFFVVYSWREKYD
ncbi:hypothetical protein SLA2020_365710 [Shorea laevis]